MAKEETPTVGEEEYIVIEKQSGDWNRRIKWKQAWTWDKEGMHGYSDNTESFKGSSENLLQEKILQIYAYMKKSNVLTK